MLIKRTRTSKQPEIHHLKTTNQTPENQKPNTEMKKCELCSHFARIYCQSDNASLCYDCDQTVHSSNFLVAKHSRTLLCHKCQSPTPWTAAGLHLGRAATVCVTCLDQDTSHRRRGDGNDVVVENRDEHEDGETDEDSTESGDESEDDDDEDAENQVVPWSSSAASPPVNAGESSDEFSSSRVSSGGFRSVDSEDDAVCSLERCNGKRSTEISISSFRPLKVIRSDRN